MSTTGLLPLAVSMGEPAGIGPDIILRLFAERETLDLPPFIVYGQSAFLKSRAKRLGISIDIVPTTPAFAPTIFETALPIVIDSVLQASAAIATVPDRSMNSVAQTGETVMIGLPRNLQNFPFREGSVMDEEFPDGFDADYLNGVSTWAQDHTELFRHARTAGTDATIMAVEGITGLEINYWAMVNLEGFRELVDAFGGVTLNVRDRIPVGLPHESYFHYIEPGVKELDGQETLWFARARYGSDDYSRMARQKCVMNAMVQQVSPQEALRNFRRIAEASSAMLSTNLPRDEVDRFIALALKAKSEKMSTLSLVPPMINTADPDIDLVHEKVREAIDRTEGDAEPAPEARKAKKRKTPTTTGGSIGSLSSGYAANEAEDLGAAC